MAATTDARYICLRALVAETGTASFLGDLSGAYFVMHDQTYSKLCRMAISCVLKCLPAGGFLIGTCGTMQYVPDI